MYKSHESKELSREKTLEQLYKAPPKLRATLKVWLNKKMESRDASDRFADQNPGAARVTIAQCKLMLQAHNAGVSFRALERVFHIRSQSGNAAQRCCRRAMRPERTPKKPVAARGKIAA